MPTARPWVTSVGEDSTVALTHLEDTLEEQEDSLEGAEDSLEEAEDSLEAAATISTVLVVARRHMEA